MDGIVKARAMDLDLCCTHDSAKDDLVSLSSGGVVATVSIDTFLFSLLERLCKGPEEVDVLTGRSECEFTTTTFTSGGEAFDSGPLLVDSRTHSRSLTLPVAAGALRWLL